MPEKPRVKAPTKRTTVDPEAAARRRRILFIVGGVGIALIAGAAVVGVLGFGGGGPDEESVRADLVAAGCTLQSFPGVSRQHISDPAAQPKQWSSFPPTSGPHYVTPAVYGFYTAPVELARILHGLEHGGVYVLYGSKVPADTESKLREIYDQDPRGLVVAQLPELGNKIALGAWTSEHPGSGEVGTGHLAKCTHVDKKAFDAFIKAFRGRGPEGAPLNLLQPGGT